MQSLILATGNVCNHPEVYRTHTVGEFGNGDAAASMIRAIGSGGFICSGLYFVEYEIPGKVTGIPPVAPTGAKIPVHPGAAYIDLLAMLEV